MEIFLSVRIYASAWLYETILICTQSRHNQMIPFKKATKNQEQFFFYLNENNFVGKMCIAWFFFLIMFEAHVHRVQNSVNKKVTYCESTDKKNDTKNAAIKIKLNEKKIQRERFTNPTRKQQLEYVYFALWSYFFETFFDPPRDTLRWLDTHSFLFFPHQKPFHILFSNENKIGTN